MKYNLLKPYGFCAFIFSSNCQFVFGDAPIQTGTQLFLNRFSDIEENQDAVCNDGTKGGYYFSPASLVEANDTFIIHLPGGGQCYDEDSCNERWKFKPSSMSSTNFPASKFKKGFMDNSMKKTPFWSANKVMLGYCSSDGYMGDTAASPNTWGWHFRGQQLVFAMIRDLIANHKLSSTSTIVFSGGSAGARGVMVLIDILVADYFPKGAKVVGFLDSPYYIDVPSYSPLYKGFQYEESMKYKHMNTKNIISPECSATYPDAKDQWKCQFGQYRMPFVKTSYFLISSQYDSYQLQMDTQTVPPYGKSATEYVSKFGSTIHNNLVILRDLKLKEVALKGSIDETYAFYSWTCYNHDVSASSEFYTMAVDEGVTQKDALEAFLKASIVAYSSTKGVISSESIRSGVSVLGAPVVQKSKGKKDKTSTENKKMSSLPVIQTAENIPESDKIALGVVSNNILKEESSVKKKVKRVSTVHSWVDSCTGMNCGTSCPASSPITKPVSSNINAKSRDRLPVTDQFDIPSMGGASTSTMTKEKRSAQMLSQYNAESDSEEDNEDEKPLFIPITAASTAVRDEIRNSKLKDVPLPLSLPIAQAVPVTVSISNSVTATLPVAVTTATATDTVLGTAVLINAPSPITEERNIKFNPLPIAVPILIPIEQEPAQSPVALPVEIPAEKPVEILLGKPVENSVEVPAEWPAVASMSVVAEEIIEKEKISEIVNGTLDTMTDSVLSSLSPTLSFSFDTVQMPVIESNSLSLSLLYSPMNLIPP